MRVPGLITLLTSCPREMCEVTHVVYTLHDTPPVVYNWDIYAPGYKKCIGCNKEWCGVMVRTYVAKFGGPGKNEFTECT